MASKADIPVNPSVLPLPPFVRVLNCPWPGRGLVKPATAAFMVTQGRARFVSLETGGQALRLIGSEELQTAIKLDHEPSLPVNRAFLERGQHGWRWIVPSCCVPLCKQRRHVHGAGLYGEDPLRFLNHRSAPCNLAGYLIEDANPADTARQLARFAEERKRGRPRCLR